MMVCFLQSKNLIAVAVQYKETPSSAITQSLPNLSMPIIWCSQTAV